MEALSIITYRLFAALAEVPRATESGRMRKVEKWHMYAPCIFLKKVPTLTHVLTDPDDLSVASFNLGHSPASRLHSSIGRWHFQTYQTLIHDLASLSCKLIARMAITISGE